MITIRQLLTHAAGLTYSFFQPEDGSYRGAGISDGLDQPGQSMEEELRRLASVPLAYEPGTSWGYSLALDVLGAILERIAETSLPEIVERFVTGALQMSDTGFSVRDSQRLATPYVDGQPSRRMNDPDVIPFLTDLMSTGYQN